MGRMTERVTDRLARGMRMNAARVGLAVAITFMLAPVAARAQGPDAGDGVRVGVTFGGISTVGFSVEFFRDNQSVDVTLGTFGFRDVGLAVIGKQYFGGRAARPFVGLGLWALAAWPADQRTGLALVARAPVGIDWSIADVHAVGAVIGLNRALAVRRPDPDDDRTLNNRIVPLPGIYYRWAP